MTKKQFKRFLKFLKSNDIILVDKDEPIHQKGKKFEINEISKKWLYDEFFEDYQTNH